MRRALIFLLVLAAGASFPAKANDWPQVVRDPGASSVSSEVLGAELEPAWVLSLGGAPILSAAVVADGVLVVGDSSGRLSAVRAQTGVPVWSDLARAGYTASAAIANGRVFAASLDGTVWARRLIDGQEIWRSSVGGQIHGSPLVRDAALFLPVGFPTNRVARIDAGTGHFLWRTPPSVSSDLMNSSPILAGSELVQSSRGGRFHRIDSSTGELRGYSDAGGTLHATHPAMVDGRVYLLTGGPAAALTAYDLRTTPATVTATMVIADPEAPPAGASAIVRHAVSSPVAAGAAIVFQVRFEYHVPALGTAAPAHHLREWLFSYDPAAASTSAVICLGRAVIRNINAVPQLGICSTPATFSNGTPGGGDTGPLVVSASSLEPRVRIIDPLTRMSLWTAVLSGPSRAPVTVANGQVFIPTDAGRLHAFRSKLNLPPSAPTGLVPGGLGALDSVRPIVRWWAAMDPEGRPAAYEVRVDDDGEILETWQERQTTGVGITQATLRTALVMGRAYAFAVRAYDEGGAWSEWSATATFVATEVLQISVGGRRFDSIEEALAAARSGDTVELGPGVLRPSRSIEVPSGVNLMGSSARATRIDATGLDVGIRLMGEGGGAGTTVSKIEVRGANRGIDVASARGVTIANVVLCDNKDSGLEIGEDGQATLVNATVVRNGVGVRALGAARVRNSIVADNETGLAAGSTGTVSSSYNDLFGNITAAYDGAAPGRGDLSDRITFVDSAARNFLITSGHDQPSTDRGDPADKFFAEPEPNGKRVNLGAFGNTADAETSRPSQADAGCAIGGGPAPPSAMPLCWSLWALATLALRRRRSIARPVRLRAASATAWGSKFIKEGTAFTGLRLQMET